MKRLFIFTIAIMLMLIGCSSDASNEEKVVLDFPTWQASEGGFSKWWKGLVSEFEKNNSNVEVNLYQIPFSDYVDQLTTRFVADDPPDIVHLPSSVFPQFASQDWLKSIDSKLSSTDVPDTWTGLQDKMVWEGNTQGLLLLGYPFMLYYNEQILKDNDLSVPTNHQELLNVASKLTGDGIYGFGMTTAEHPDVYGDASITLTGLGQNWVKDGEYNINNPEFIKAMDIHRELFNYSPKGVSSEQKRQLFFDGKIAMMLEGPFVADGIENAAEDVKPHLKITSSPFANKPGAVSNSLHIPKNIDSEKEKLVWEFMELAASKEWQEKYAELTNSIPPRKNIVPDELIQENHVMKVMSEDTPNAVLIEPDSKNLQENYNQFTKTVSSYIVQLMTTDKPTKDILKELMTELEGNIKP